MAESLEKRPPRVTIGNFETGETRPCQFNPKQVVEELAAQFNKLAIMGYSHRPMQYTGTDNLTVAFDLDFQARVPGTLGQDTLLETRKFLHAFFYPRRSALAVSGGGPPRCLFIWPSLYTLVGRLTKLRITSDDFKQDNMSLLSFVASVAFEEATVRRITSEDVRSNGTMRGG